MKKQYFKIALLAMLGMLLPLFSRAQDGGVASDLLGLQSVLETLYNQMMPLCSQMIGVAQAIAGFAALWYIGSRVWKHIAANETIDVYPLLRPFALGICIMIFPQVLALMNGVLQPTVAATQAMATNSNAAIANLLADKPLTDNEQPAPSTQNTDPDKWYQYSHPDNSTASGTNSNPIASAFSGWSIKDMARKWIAELLNVLFEAAALCLDTIRTFKLIVLAILGPLCFGLSVFDGFQHTLKQWIARYVNVFMWLPIANIFGAIIAKIQENMITLQQSGNLGGNSFGNDNTAYLIFLLIGIIGYFTVPSIANYIMNVGGHALFNRTSAVFSQASSFVSGMFMRSVFQAPPPKTDNQPNTEKLAGKPAKSS